MGSSGVVTLVIVVIWSVYLVPTWLRRQDLPNESRSVDRFSRAMRILSRRRATPDRRYVVRPAVAATSPRSSMAARRRVLIVVSMLTLGATTASLLGVVGWWAAAAAATLLVAYLTHLRSQTRVAREVARRRQQTQRRVQARARQGQLVPGQVRAGAGGSHQAGLERTAETDTAREARYEENPAAAVLDRRVDSAWHPVPVPLPTYVTAPKAVRPVRASSRVIDLTQRGAWSEGQRVDEPVPVVPAFATERLSLSDAEVTEDDPWGEDGEGWGAWGDVTEDEEFYPSRRAVGD